LDPDKLYRVTDAIISIKPRGVAISGGEPLVVGEIFEVADRMSKAGVEVYLYTSGWAFAPTMLRPIVNSFARVSVSVDGATPEVHDRIRGRTGSFDRAMNALHQLDCAVRDRRRLGGPTPSLGIDFVVLQSNFAQLGEVCASIAPQFPELQFISFGAVIPSGLASRVGFVEHEMLNEEQEEMLTGAQMAHELKSLAPASVEVRTTNNRDLQMHPDLLAAGGDIPAMHVEPDGMVRAMPMYEGTVGSLLGESASVLWKRAVDRLSDPFVIEVLKPARTRKAWAEATRRIDQHFGSLEVRARIARRPRYAPN
jgi:organic radical activating enzyme